ncbi:MAG: diaminobutyrate--2-oxoglutarate transaminase [Clostridia bacterium]|nr:diaminobutyrate--2-oxoglutarate transaminase [Clostridia bacterium]
MDIFEQVESEVRSYCRSFPAVFDKAEGCYIYGEDGTAYLDFFAGAGALNYGHNNPYITDKLIAYLKNNGILHALDMHTTAKRSFLEHFENSILKPRGLDYKVMFPAPTGTNAVESAFKLARKVKKRQTVFAFTGAFHGMTLGALAATSNSYNRDASGTALQGVTFMPFPYGFNKSFDTIAYMENVLTDDHSGSEIPAAVIVETVQAEGGIIPVDTEWLRRLRALCDKYGILLIVDDIQIGCGRTGDFFSFERAGIVPDMVTLSKSIGGCGLPMALLLLKPELDIWKPAEHNGTFRGNQLAFVAADAALDVLEKEDLLLHVRKVETFLKDYIEKNILPLDPRISYRGRGLIYGIDFSALDPSGELAGKISKLCFKKNLIIERSGRNDTVLKILPPLVITEEELKKGLQIIESSAKEVLGK